MLFGLLNDGAGDLFHIVSSILDLYRLHQNTCVYIKYFIWLPRHAAAAR